MGCRSPSCWKPILDFATYRERPNHRYRSIHCNRRLLVVQNACFECMVLDVPKRSALIPAPDAPVRAALVPGEISPGHLDGTLRSAPGQAGDSLCGAFAGRQGSE